MSTSVASSDNKPQVGPQVENRPQEFFTPAALATLAGASAAVWIVVTVCSSFGAPQYTLRYLALAVSFLVVLSTKQARKMDQLLVTFLNVLLVYCSATGANAMGSGTTLWNPRVAASVTASSVLPLLNEKAWWEPVELLGTNEALRQQGQDLAERVVAPLTKGLELSTDRKLEDEPAILASAGDVQRKAIIEAIALYSKRPPVPYRWGGKDEQGLDSSGFVAYVLAKAGVIKDPSLYWSGKLQHALANVRPGEEKVGDIKFYSSGACMIYLGNDLSIGMLPGGIATGSLDTPNSPFEKRGIGRY